MYKNVCMLYRNVYILYMCTYMLYRSICPLVVESHTTWDEGVNPLTPKKYKVLNGNFVFDLRDRGAKWDCLYCPIITTELAQHKVLSNSDSCNQTCDYAWCIWYHHCFYCFWWGRALLILPHCTIRRSKGLTEYLYLITSEN